jgi:hypothetical protein
MRARLEGTCPHGANSGYGPPVAHDRVRPGSQVQREVRRPDQRRGRVQGDTHLNALHHLGEPPLVREPAQETTVPEDGQDLRPDAAAHEHAADREQATPKQAARGAAPGLSFR